MTLKEILHEIVDGLSNPHVGARLHEAIDALASDIEVSVKKGKSTDGKAD